MRQPIVLSILLCLVSTPTLAFEVPVAADKVLWCGSAFYWLANSASDAGDEQEADQYQHWSDRLLEQGVDLLTAAGADPETIDGIISDYDNAVVAEMGTPAARFDVTTCPDLLAAPAN